MKLGEGKTGHVYDLCDLKHYISNKETFCKIIEKKSDKIAEVILYSIDTNGVINTETIIDQNEILEFLDVLSKQQELVAKIFKNASTLTGIIHAKNTFTSEIEGIATLINVLGMQNVFKFTPLQYIKYKDYSVFGVCITTKQLLKKEKEYVLFSEKCSITLEDLCRQSEYLDITIIEEMTRTIFKILKILQTKNIAHGDIKPANIMLCGKEWKLIDWNMWRDLNYNNLMKKDGIIPKHRGSSPFYYMLHNFTYLDAMKKNYANDMMMGQFYSKIRSPGMKLLTKSVDSFQNYKSYSKTQLFDTFKFHGDLHSFGIMLYAINYIFIKNMDLKLFCLRLCIADEKMILNAQSANKIFATMDLQNPVNKWRGKPNRSSSSI
jgi:serine/threonine protein kinase